jgi:hypothetical protein
VGSRVGTCRDSGGGGGPSCQSSSSSSLAMVGAIAVVNFKQMLTEKRKEK